MQRSMSMVIPAAVMMAFILAGCSGDGCPGNHRPPRNEASVTISQGVWGDVWFWQGDFMPVCPQGTVLAVSREVVVFEQVATGDIFPPGDSGTFFDEIPTDEIARVESNTRGFFQIELPPGDYSVFVVEGDRYYANSFDGDGNILPFTVAADSVSDVLINITYMSDS